MMLRLILLVFLPLAHTQLLDYEYADMASMTAPAVDRMPMSDISAQQRVELAMIAANSEPFYDRSRFTSTANPLPSVWSKSWPNAIPAITTSTSLPITSAVEIPFGKPNLFSFLSNNAGSNAEKSFATLLKILPDPSALFSIDKLFHSFKHDGDNYGDGITETTNDPHLNALVTPKTGLFGVNSERASESTKEEPTSTITIGSTDKPDAGDNLLGSLLQGRLGEIDWIGSLLGTKQAPSKEGGNAIAQIFKGGLFGPADDSIPLKVSPRHTDESK